MRAFFFRRGGGDQAKPDKFFTTIAHQLLLNRRSTEPHILKAIENDSGIISSGANADKQFEQLILQPLRSSNDSSQNSQMTIIVIDALDECADSETKTVSDITRLLMEGMAEHRAFLKVFITSRHENPFTSALDSTHISPEVLVLDQFNQESGAEDIKSFLEEQLGRISNERKLAGWPDSNSVDRLVAKANLLFIFATTMVLFIEDKVIGDPKGNLEFILDPRKRFQGTRLDDTYTPILDHLLYQRTAKGMTLRPKEDLRTIAERFEEVVGSIVLLSEYLSVESLANLLQIDSNIVETALVSLRPVLKIPDNNKVPIEPLHLSFRDFLVDKDKKDEYSLFCVDEKKQHTKLADLCLEILNDGNYLTKDICKLGKLGPMQDKITQRSLDEHLPAHVRYACLYWVHHWKEGSKEKSDAEKGNINYGLVGNFLSTRFLYWLEALSLLDKATDSINMISNLIELAKVRQPIHWLDIADELISIVHYSIPNTKLLGIFW